MMNSNFHDGDMAKAAENAELRAVSEIKRHGGERVLVAMSGGVDSAVAVYLLGKAGCECVGVTMRLHDESLPMSDMLPSEDDGIADAERVATIVGIPHVTLDLREEFRHRVVSKFASEYESGRTPNPCVECNRHLKLSYLMDYALSHGFDGLATGHYARVTPDGRIRRATDLQKDQSYMLFPIPAASINHLILPLGTLSKDEVRAIATRRGLPVASKADSQDICFMPRGGMRRFLEEWHSGPFQEGPVIDDDGTVVGTHRGLPLYTIGQRRGLGIALGRPRYVIGKDSERNALLLGDEEDLRRRDCLVTDMCWHVSDCERDHAGRGQSLVAVLRYQGEETRIAVSQEGGTWDTVRLLAHDAPFPYVAPGQYAVLYDGDLVVGGGTIA